MSIADKLTQIAENEKKVYESGKQAEYDAFWNAYQQNGNQTDYRFAFGGYGWTENNFKPKYDIRPTNLYFAFRGSLNLEIDFVEHLDSLGRTFDTSNCTDFAYFMYDTRVKRLGVIDLSKSTQNTGALGYCYKLETVDKIIMSATTHSFSNVLISCPLLTSITFEGEIAANGLNLQWSTKLNKASITSVINCLSTTTSGLSVTLSKSAVNTAFETSTGAADGSTSSEWLNLIATRSNWTISLA